MVKNYATDSPIGPKKKKIFKNGFNRKNTLTFFVVSLFFLVFTVNARCLKNSDVFNWSQLYPNSWVKTTGFFVPYSMICKSEYASTCVINNVGEFLYANKRVTGKGLILDINSNVCKLTNFKIEL